jgi:hypothetical protein
MSKSATLHTELFLPCFKQGDDLGHHLSEARKTETEEHLQAAKAFNALAEQYDDCATLCRQAAKVFVEHPDLLVDADCHHIGVSGPRAVLEPLTRVVGATESNPEGLFQHDPADEEYEEYEDEDDDSYDEEE